MKVSVCITVLNEEKSIKRLITSLLSQSKTPNEIIIIDAGSTDNTINIIKRYKKIRLFVKKGVSIAKGRNIAVKKAKYNVIAMTDAGCICHKSWLKNLTSNPSDVSAGFYKMTGNSSFQKAVKPFLGIMPDKFNENTFLPSARSIAFKKSAWEKVGGFSEKFNRAGEDYDFSLKIQNKNLIIKRYKYATVDWEVPNKLLDATKKFYYYSKGDTESNNFFSSHNIHTLSIFFRYFLLIGLLLLSLINPSFLIIFLFILFFYFSWAFNKSFKYTQNWKVGVWGTIIQLASDLAIMLGFTSALWATLNK